MAINAEGNDSSSGTDVQFTTLKIVANKEPAEERTYNLQLSKQLPSKSQQRNGRTIYNSQNNCHQRASRGTDVQFTTLKTIAIKEPAEERTYNL